MTDEDRKMLEEEGWNLDCELPFELSREDGSFASGQAADIVLDALREERASALVLGEVKREDLKPGQDYLLCHEYSPERGGGEWIFAVWKMDETGWAADDVSDMLPDWPTHIFESPDARRLVGSE